MLTLVILGAAFNEMTKGLAHLRELQNEFVFIASHELKVPVTAIRWSAAEINKADGEVSDINYYLLEGQHIWFFSAASLGRVSENSELAYSPLCPP